MCGSGATGFRAVLGLSLSDLLRDVDPDMMQGATVTGFRVELHWRGGASTRLHTRCNGASPFLVYAFVSAPAPTSIVAISTFPEETAM